MKLERVTKMRKIGKAGREKLRVVLSNILDKYFNVHVNICFLKKKNV